jgi:hypothetical protein
MPELAVAKELGGWGLFAVRGRVYRQRGASFWDAHYHRIERLMSGDPRLGSLTETGGAAELRIRAGRRAWVSASYELSRLEYDDWPVPPITGHLVTGGLSVRY